MSSARAAFSRKREPKSAVELSSPMTRSSISVGSTISSSVGGGASASGRWIAIPSSDQSDCASRPSASRSRIPIAIAHGACTRAPNGVRRQTRQSPISSRKRSTTTVRSDGTAPVAFCWSFRNVSRFCAACSSSECSLVSRSIAFCLGQGDQLSGSLADLPRRARTADPGPRPSRTGSALAPPEQERRARGRA